MSIKEKAEKLARDAGMQYDHRYRHWVSVSGKFESEEWYAPYYYAALCEGDGEVCYADGEECDSSGTLFQVDSEESEAFNLDCGAWILLREDSQGFVYVTVHDSREAAEKRFNEWIGV